MNVSAHKDRLGDALAVVSDMIFAPKFTQGDWDRVMEQHLAGLQQSRQDSSGWLPIMLPIFSMVQTILLEDLHREHRQRLETFLPRMQKPGISDV